MTAGPVNGKTKDDRHDFFLPKQYCHNGQTGKLYIQLIVDGRNLGNWGIDVEFEGF
jgi:hypothetical protein